MAGQSFQLETDFELRGDQPRAIDQLTEGLSRGDRSQVLLGVTGSGKTFTMAQCIARVNRPTLVMAHNKTLAAQFEIGDQLESVVLRGHQNLKAYHVHVARSTVAPSTSMAAGRSTRDGSGLWRSSDRAVSP